ncbi:hypothetical protein GF323_01185 [Candidatus Woesearchaeota archaeon]|nr:hypothetical protein [Candidatus Woesearchaeota archaeon]
MSRIINIIGNSGAGKSILALNLGISLANQGRDVIVVDANIYSPDILNYSDISPGVFLNDFLRGEKRIEETIAMHPSGIKMIASLAEEEHDIKKHHKINRGLLSLIGKSEVILVDSFFHSPAVSALGDIADDTIFVTNDDYASILKTKESIDRLEKQGISIIGIIVNKRRKKGIDLKHLEAILQKKIIGEIPYDERIIESVNAKQPFYLRYSNSRASRGIRQIAELINFWNR